MFVNSRLPLRSLAHKLIQSVLRIIYACVRHYGEHIDGQVTQIFDRVLVCFVSCFQQRAGVFSIKIIIITARQTFKIMFGKCSGCTHKWHNIFICTTASASEPANPFIMYTYLILNSVVLAELQIEIVSALFDCRCGILEYANRECLQMGKPIVKSHLLKLDEFIGV